MLNKVIWGNRTADQVRRYADLCHNALRDSDFPRQFLQCSDRILCRNIQHRSIINNIYEQIVYVLQTAAITCHNTFVKKKICYWLERTCKRGTFKATAWVSGMDYNGKPMSGEVYKNM